MTNKKDTPKQDVSTDLGTEIVGQLEHVFLAGLGALSNAQKAGGKAFDALVEQGQSFRRETGDRTEALIDNVQGAIREMSDDAQSRASGLLSHMRETPQMTKLQTVFDDRVAEALDRLGVASKQSIDEMNAKLDKVLQAMEAEQQAATPKKSAKKKAAKKKTAAKKTAAKKATKKKAASKKTAAKKAPGKAQD